MGSPLSLHSFSIPFTTQATKCSGVPTPSSTVSQQQTSPLPVPRKMPPSTHTAKWRRCPQEWKKVAQRERQGIRIRGRLAGNRSYKSQNPAGEQGQTLTRISRQAALRRVIWSAMVRVVKPGSCLANSTVLMMHLVESSLNLSQRSMSRETRCSELLFWGRQGGSGPWLQHRHPLQPGRSLPVALCPAYAS